MKKKVLKSATIAAITATAKAASKAEASAFKMLDLLRADGVKGAMLVAPKRGEENRVYTEVREAIVASLSIREQKLLASPAKGLTEAKKKAKVHLMKGVSGRLGGIRRDLLKREARQGVDGRATSRKRTPKVRMTASLNDAIKVLQNWEEPTGIDVEALQKALNNALAMIAKAK